MKSKDFSREERQRVKHTRLSVIRSADGWELYPPEDLLKTRLRRKRLTALSNPATRYSTIAMFIWIIYGTIILLTN